MGPRGAIRPTGEASESEQHSSQRPSAISQISAGVIPQPVFAKARSQLPMRRPGTLQHVHITEPIRAKAGPQPRSHKASHEDSELRAPLPASKRRVPARPIPEDPKKVHCESCGRPFDVAAETVWQQPVDPARFDPSLGLMPWDE